MCMGMCSVHRGQEYWVPWSGSYRWKGAAHCGADKLGPLQEHAPFY